MRGIVVGTNMVLRKSLPTAILALGLMAFAALFLMPRLDGLANRVVSEGVDYFRGRLQTALGLSLSFESLSPSILRSASFSRLSISAPGGRSLISAGRVRVRYDIVALLQGRKSEVLTGLELEDVTLDLRLPEGSIGGRLVAHFSSSTISASTISSSLTSLVPASLPPAAACSAAAAS